uniref:hypothetical protein n=1 Tax=Paenibacillus polymyxa TaxID=1406 RepID=UPI003EBC04C6
YKYILNSPHPFEGCGLFALWLGAGETNALSSSPVKEDQPSVGSSSFVKPLKAYFTTVDTA